MGRKRPLGLPNFFCNWKRSRDIWEFFENARGRLVVPYGPTTLYFIKKTTNVIKNKGLCCQNCYSSWFNCLILLNKLKLNNVVKLCIE